MNRAGFFIAFGIVAYLLIVVFTLPAVQVKNYIEEQIPGLSLSAVSGSVFRGQAGHASFNDIALGSAHWRFLPLALLTGRVEYHLEFSSPEGPGHANAGISLAGNAYGHDIDISFLAEDIINQYSPVAVSASGELNLLVETIVMNDDFPRDIDGRVVWKSAALLSPVEMVLGDTLMDFQRLENELVGIIENEGDFRVSGDIAITPSGAYGIDLLLSPNATVSRDMVLLLESTTAAQAGGKYRIQYTGQW